jgi:glycolate oxidase iron-sulfur subunit
VNSARAQPEPFLDYDKALACIHCGLCLSSCPTYLETGNENDSPRGRIYLMRATQDGRLPVGEVTVRHIDLCLGCRACEAVCPSGVQYGALLETTRDHVEKNYNRSIFQRLLRRVGVEQVFPFPDRMRLALSLAKLTKRLGLDTALPQFARDALDLIPDDTSSAALPESSPALTETKRGRVGFIQGCVQSVMFGLTNAATVRLLNRAGYDVVTPPAQVCCGALYAHSGNLKDARACARRNIEVFEKLGLDAILTNAAGCGSTLKEYGQLLHDDPPWAERGRKFSEKVKDLTEFLTSPLVQITPHSSVSATRITYHDACHLAHAQRITKPPRELVRSVAGERFVEMPESDVCCGSAGSYNLTEPEMAERLQKRKIQNILKTGAELVVTSNPGCILQLRAGLRKAGATRIQVVHIADFLDRAIEGSGK